MRGFDISPTSGDRARENVAAREVADRYTVDLADFFDQVYSAAAPGPSTVIANPPYIPAPDRDILMPELWGGEYGNDLTLRLLGAQHRHLIVALPSYADPVTTLTTATALGYWVINFLATGLDFGYYSSEAVVRRQIDQICAAGRGWAGGRVHGRHGLAHPGRRPAGRSFCPADACPPAGRLTRPLGKQAEESRSSVRRTCRTRGGWTSHSGHRAGGLSAPNARGRSSRPQPAAAGLALARQQCQSGQVGTAW